MTPMLRRTFLHVSGIGETTERRLWDRGITSWERFLEGACRADQRADLELSVRAYERGDWSHFDRALPTAHKWRVLDDLADRAGYVDIETSGGNEPDDLTVLGVYDGRVVRSFVAGENLDEAGDYLAQFPLWVTYNGALFDLPFIRRRFRHHAFNHVHVDLRYPLHRLGHKGGLKKVEQQLCLTRSEATRGLDGWDAVRLWRYASQGDDAARRLLLAYNAEDVVNLKPLAEYVRSRMGEAVMRKP